MWTIGKTSTSDRPTPRRTSRRTPRFEPLEGRALMATTAGTVLAQASPDILLPSPDDPAESPAIFAATLSPTTQLSPDEVNQLLDRASAATPSTDAIIAIVDRGGRVLGVRAEAGVSPQITNNVANLVFSVDGALSLARTGAFFGNNQAPLTSRTIQNLSESTRTQREVQSNPSITDVNSPFRGPGFVGGIGIKGHFPRNVPFTPQVDLFQIEHTNRDATFNPGPDRIKGTPDDVQLPNRFNVANEDIPLTIFNPSNPNQPDLRLTPPDSYGFVSGLAPTTQSRGIGTLPGGIPIIRVVNVDGVDRTIVVGGIGVFFPGTTGYANEENSTLNDFGYNPRLPDRSAEAEVIAFAALGGATNAQVLTGAKTTVGPLDGVAPVRALDLLPGPKKGQYRGRIDLVGITLDVFGPHGNQGPGNLIRIARRFGLGSGVVNGTNLPISSTAGAPTTRAGQAVPNGWLVTPHDGVGITAEDVVTMITNGVARANLTRAAIRLPYNRHVRMVFAVTDSTGEVLGLYRMPDATIFSIDVAVAKARNVSYYNDPTQLQAIDQVPGVAPGTSFTSRTFRYLGLSFFPEGIDTYPSGPFSILNDGGTSVAAKGATIGAPLPASAFQSVVGYDAFNPGTNFRAQTAPENQNGIVFFPGSSSVYKDLDGDGIKEIVGGLGISGDGVDQDDVVTFSASLGYRPVDVPRADQIKVRGVRLPYQKFNRNPNV